MEALGLGYGPPPPKPRPQLPPRRQERTTGDVKSILSGEACGWEQKATVEAELDLSYGPLKKRKKNSGSDSRRVTSPPRPPSTTARRSASWLEMGWALDGHMQWVQTEKVVIKTKKKVVQQERKDGEVLETLRSSFR